MRNRFTLTLTILCGFLVSVDTSAETSSIVDKGDYKYLSITSGPLNGKIAWAFDTPGGGSNALGLLLQSLRGANKIVWASYKPTHPAVVELLKGHKWAWGVYDENYCGRHCEDAFDGNKKVSSVELGVYKESSRRKWFVMHHKFASLDYSKGKSSLTNPSSHSARRGGERERKDKRGNVQSHQRNPPDSMNSLFDELFNEFWRVFLVVLKTN